MSAVTSSSSSTFVVFPLHDEALDAPAGQIADFTNVIMYC